MQRLLLTLSPIIGGGARIIRLRKNAVISVSPRHIRLNPGKLNGASSDRNKAVSGLKINGDMMLAAEVIPERHP